MVVVSPGTHPRSRRHAIPPIRNINLSIFNRLALASRLLYSSQSTEATMETMLQGFVIIGGLTFSLAASVLIEELIFGQIVRTAFARGPQSPKHAPKN
jgi:hypothetical protein